MLRRLVGRPWTVRLKVLPKPRSVPAYRFITTPEGPRYEPLGIRFSTRLVVSSRSGIMLASADTTWATWLADKYSPEEIYRLKAQVNALLEDEVAEQELAAIDSRQELLELTSAVEALELATWRNKDAVEDTGSATP